MIRRIAYRDAVTAFVFMGLWFVLGLLMLWSPIPGALGIPGQMLVAWLLLFLLIMGASGALLTAASFNGIFPAKEDPAPKQLPAPKAVAPSDAAVASDGRPLPWSESPLPTPVRRSSGATTAVRPSRGGSPPARGR